MKFDEITKDWILKEIEKVKYSLKQNDIIRYNLTRAETPSTKSQSVAEHLYNMLILAHYFRDLEDPEHKMDFEKIVRMILMHDMGEIETGDIVMGQKTENQKELETNALLRVKEKTPEFISKNISELCEEYDHYKTQEAKYVKALDKLEQQFWHSVYCDPSMVCSVCSLEERNRNELKRREIYKKCGFMFIEKFALTIHQQMRQKYPEYSTLD